MLARSLIKIPSTSVKLLYDAVKYSAKKIVKSFWKRFVTLQLRRKLFFAKFVAEKMW